MSDDGEDVELLAAEEVAGAEEENLLEPSPPGHVDKSCRSFSLSPYPVVIVFLALSLLGLILTGLVLDKLVPEESMWMAWGLFCVAQVGVCVFIFYFFFFSLLCRSFFYLGVVGSVYGVAVDLCLQGCGVWRPARLVLEQGVLECFCGWIAACDSGFGL